MYGEIFFFILIPYASDLSYSIFTLNTALIWIRIHNTARNSQIYRVMVSVADPYSSLYRIRLSHTQSLYLSEREGEEGLMMNGESNLRRVSYCRDPQSDIVRDRGAPTTHHTTIINYLYKMFLSMLYNRTAMQPGTDMNIFMNFIIKNIYTVVNDN